MSPDSDRPPRPSPADSSASSTSRSVSEEGHGSDRLAGSIADAEPIDWDTGEERYRRSEGRLEGYRAVASVAEAFRSIRSGDGSIEAGEDAEAGEGVAHDGEALGFWGHLELRRVLGRGGFGTVYEAFDPSLRREVALKLLSAPLAEGSRGDRFLDEARRLAKVRHPNVLTVHGAAVHEGRPGLWADLVRGKTLREWVSDNGPMGPAEAVSVGVDVCRALAAIHRAGLIHGDVKPSNVMREVGGRVVLMDFGAARDHGRGDGEPVAGTPAVVAPEVLEGESPATASDLYSVGVLLYFLLTGQFPLQEETFRSVRQAHDSGRRSPLNDVRSNLPRSLVEVVETAMEPDPERRFRSAGEMERALSSAGGMPVVVSERSEVRRKGVWGILAALVLGAGLGFLLFQGLAPEPRLTYLSIDLPAGAVAISGPALSPDGRRVAYGLQQGDEPGLYVRPLDRPEAVRISGAENASGPFFSPDGRWIGYHDTKAKELRKIPANGGSPFTICEAEWFGGADWRKDGTIVFSIGPPYGLWTVPAAGGEPRILTETRPRPGEDREDTHGFPHFLPGGQTVLFTAWSPGGDPEYRIAIAELATGKIRSLFEGASAVYSESGHLLYLRPADRALVAVPFDLGEERVVGDPTVVASDVRGISLARDGTLVYAAAREKPLRLAWLSFDGSTRPLPLPERHYGQISLAPNGGRAAVAIEERNAEPTIWLLDLERGTSGPITTYRGRDSFPVWAPDGDSIVFASDRDGPPTLYRVSADGGEPDRVTTEDLAFHTPTSFTPDGRHVLFSHFSFDTGGTTVEKPDLRMVDLDSGEVTTLLESPAAEHGGRISPDGRWLAYVSDESGHDEVYLRSFPDLDRKRRVSLGGVTGREPGTSVAWLHWGNEGKRLFFGQEGATGPIFKAVEIRTEPVLTIGEPKVVVTAPPGMESGDLAPGGERFLIAESTGDPEPEIVVVLGWSQSMEDR